jgi:hypothetical protein
MEVLCQIKQSVLSAEHILFNMAIVVILTNVMCVAPSGNRIVLNVKKVFVLVGVECSSWGIGSLGAFTCSRVGGSKCGVAGHRRITAKG